MLIKNAQNLMKAVIKTVQAAEAACMKVRQSHEDHDNSTTDICYIST